MRQPGLLPEIQLFSLVGTGDAYWRQTVAGHWINDYL
jgi:hypothetical protein